MRRAVQSVLILSLFGGCKAIEAPDSMEEMMVYGFAHFDEEPEYTSALAENLVPWVETHVEELTEGYLVDALTAEHLEAAGIVDANIDGVIGAASSVQYASSLSDVALGVTHPDKQDIYEKTVDYSVSNATDWACFLRQECMSYSYEVTEHATVTLIGDTFVTSQKAARWIELEDGSLAMVMRTLSPDPVEDGADWLTVSQQYGYSFFYDTGDGARRIEGFWVQVDVVDIDVPDSFAVSQAVNRMHSSAEELDLWLQEQ